MNVLVTLRNYPIIPSMDHAESIIVSSDERAPKERCQSALWLVRKNFITVLPATKHVSTK